MALEDKQLVCIECGNSFSFTVGEQQFYKEKGFENEPKRCPACRSRRKREKRTRKNPSRDFSRGRGR